MVAVALGLYTLALPAHSLLEIIVRAFYALHDTKTPVVIGIAAMGLNICLSLTFIRVFRAMGWPPHGGLALSNSLATTIEMAVLLGIIRRRLGGLEGARMVRSLLQIGLSAAVMGVVAGILAWLLADTSAWLSGGLAAGAGIVVYGGVSLIAGAPEPRSVWAIIRARRGWPATGSK
jgi:putative peptidoglycan lipid II flippase